MVLSNINTNINPKSNTMNKIEFKQAHSDVYSEIVKEGENKEKERVASWMAYNEADPKSVSEGIVSGLEITPSQSHAFLVKMASNGRVTDLKSDNAVGIVTAQTTTIPEEVISADEKELKSAFDFDL